MRRVFVLLFCMIIRASAEEELKTFYQTDMIIKAHTFHLWVALDNQQRREGLRKRTLLSEDQAMLFCFPVPQTQYFTMEETSMALDIIFFQRDGRIVNIYRSVPPYSSEPIVSSKELMFALEVAGGTSEHLLLHEGEYLRLPQDIVSLLNL